MSRPSESERETVVLVACVKGKGATPSPARDLYQSDWFRKARAYAEAVGDRWYILSAKYGLVPPDAVIAPYEKTLKRMPAHERRIWGQWVVTDLLSVLTGTTERDGSRDWRKRHSLPSAAPVSCRLVILAGADYRTPLLEALALREGWDIDVETPLAGKGIGQQLQWMNKAIAELNLAGRD